MEQGLPRSTGMDAMQANATVTPGQPQPLHRGRVIVDENAQSPTSIAYKSFGSRFSIIHGPPWEDVLVHLLAPGRLVEKEQVIAVAGRLDRVRNGVPVNHADCLETPRVELPPDIGAQSFTMFLQFVYSSPK
jgi:hypothetical protein